MWVAPSSGLLTRLDAADRAGGAPGGPQRRPDRNRRSLRRGGVTDSEANNVTRVDPTGLLTSIAVGNGPSGIAVGWERPGSRTRSTGRWSASIRSPDR